MLALKAVRAQNILAYRFLLNFDCSRLDNDQLMSKRFKKKKNEGYRVRFGDKAHHRP